MNQAWSRLRSSALLCLVLSFCLIVTTCAVPVLPAILYLRGDAHRIGGAAGSVHRAQHAVVHDLPLLVGADADRLHP